MSGRITSIIDYLNDSQLVAQIQKYFGIEALDFTKIESDDDNNNDDEVDGKHENKKKKVSFDKYNGKYRINNHFFYYFFAFITHFGHEVFYILFLPISAWNFDDHVMYLTCISWAISMYLGQASKEIVKYHRPQTPPVVKLENMYRDEYGFPSTHSMAAMSISLTFITLVFDSGLVNSSQVALTRSHAILIAIFFCIFVSLSRIYLGMHTLLDVIAGTISAYVLSKIFLYFVFKFDSLVQTSFFYGLLFYSLCIVVCLLYPTTDRWSTARADTILILGVAAGLILGMAIKYSLNLTHIGKLSLKFEVSLFYLLIVSLRILVGCLLIFMVRFISKKLIFYAAIHYFNYDKYLDIKNNEIINEKIHLKELVKRKFSFEFCLYFFTYSAVSFTVIFTCFLFFELFNLK